mmetsp:Transcript_24628/g.51116  ORF Transcript_24628/g.51116 Transcript_24628/m.51116 type:complete len:241 (+) Transcript_24628:75-797(+)
MRQILFNFVVFCSTASAFLPSPGRHVNLRSCRHAALTSNTGGGENDDNDFYDAEDAAAFDAHDLSDAGMEAAAMERAVMMAEEFKKQPKSVKDSPKIDGQTKSIFRHGLDESDEEFSEAEEEAAFDAHDLSDAGMEAASMERALMMAEEYRDAHSHQKEKKPKNDSKDMSAESKKSIFRHGLDESDDEFAENEEEAAFDAHDLSDSGMEAAAMERALMMAEEYREAHSHPHDKEKDQKHS